jgi:predicted RNA binding protein YcfA (HicA-like mRNA interferase family)
MPIDYSRLRSLTAKELISALIKAGFYLERGSGGHQHYRHPDGRRVTVSFHRSSATFPPKTLKSMIELQAKWTEEDLKKLGLI